MDEKEKKGANRVFLNKSQLTLLLHNLLISYLPHQTGLNLLALRGENYKEKNHLKFHL